MAALGHRTKEVLAQTTISVHTVQWPLSPGGSTVMYDHDQLGSLLCRVTAKA